MILLECIHLFEGVLVVTNKRCYIQKDDKFTLTEYNVPIFFDDGEKLEVYIDLDEYLVDFIKKFPIVKVFEKWLDFGIAKYTFQLSESMLETSIPELSCICELPEITEQVTLQVVDGFLVIKFGKIEYRLPTLYSSDSVQVSINANFLPSGLCKISISENTPIVIETDKKILYIAPIQ
jgi:hypothetical protein